MKFLSNALWGVFIGMMPGLILTALAGEWKHFAAYCAIAYAAETGAIEFGYKAEAKP